mgnify:CR=1 FL=1
MKNFKTTMICILSLAACSISGAALSLAQNSVSANALEPAASLFLPNAYHQYLDLNAPTDVAVNEDYTAIADGNVIYVYDQADGVYREYVHSVNADPLKNNVTKLQFDEAGYARMYFFDTCRAAIRTLPTLSYSASNPEDLDTEGEDHAADEIRYLCMSRPIPPRGRQMPAATLQRHSYHHI